VSDPRFLRGGRGIDITKELDQIALGAIGPIDERQDADEERKERDEREEDLVGDRAGEERAVVVGETLDDGSAARNRAG
jgi:hypothetical protein